MFDNLGVVFFLSAVLIVAAIGVVYITLSQKGAGRLNVSRYQARWLAIENSVSKTNSASWQVAVFDADKLLDQAMREKRVKGATMGERLKSANKTWSKVNDVWGAHKVRNRLAHESDMKLNYELTRRSLSAFRQALKDLGAI
ncbi:MAG: hypothetical protein ABI397_02790 [Candidatus Saccharimonas sp.]